MTLTTLIIILTHIAVIGWLAHCNINLCLEKQELSEEIGSLKEQLTKIKLLNRLKVDFEGNPISYQGEV